MAKMTLTPEQEKDLRALALAFKADIDASTDDFYTIEECSEALARIRRALEEAQAKLTKLEEARALRMHNQDMARQEKNDGR